MLMKEDWLLRQIDVLIQFIVRMLSKDKENQKLTTDHRTGQADRLQEELELLLDEGKLSEAENHLFNCLDGKDEASLAAAVDFYQRLNQMSDQQLGEGDFTREEVMEGLLDTLNRYGIALNELGLS